MTPTGLGLTWWGHSSASVDLGDTRVAVDPLLTDRLFHLRRYAPRPGPDAWAADLVLVSHLHPVHVPSLRRFAPEVPIVVPRGGEVLLRGPSGPGRVSSPNVVAVVPGDVLDLADARVTVLPATHDGRRHVYSRLQAPALGFRVEAQGHSFWFPGDTELREDMRSVPPVDLALVPVGGWGPTLASGHMHPEEAAVAVGYVGATVATPVHWGTFWPMGLARVDRRRHHRLFTTPGERFVDALDGLDVDTRPLLVPHGTRAVL